MGSTLQQKQSTEETSGKSRIDRTVTKQRIEQLKAWTKANFFALAILAGLLLLLRNIIFVSCRL